MPERLMELAAPPTRTVLFVDDGSTDGTLAILRALEEEHPRKVEVLALERNRGKGEAVRAGLLHAIAGGAKVVGYFDADLATPPSEMVRLLGHVSPGGPRFAMASRAGVVGRDRGRDSLGRIFSTAAALALALRVSDTQCGAKVIAVDELLVAALAEPFTSRWVFDVELILRLMAPGGMTASDFVEMPLREWRDVSGSKLSQAGMAGALLDLVRLGWQARHGRARRGMQLINTAAPS